MLSARGWIVLCTGVFLWIAARMVGSPGLHIVAVGVTLLPVVAWVFVMLTRHRLSITRRLSSGKIPLGHRLTVELEVENDSATTTSFVLLEDRVPISLGRSPRLVLTGLPGNNAQRVQYTVACRTRGRFALGPLILTLSDPFALARIRLEYPHEDHVVVFPEVENLEHGLPSPFGSGGGHSVTRHLLPAGEEFYTMREYQLGDDLRRIHWPSVARRNILMIRQDEASRRGTATVFLDNRASALGTPGEPGFERAISVAASLGVLLTRTGFSVRLATTEARPAGLSEEQLLEKLAGLAHAHSATLATSLAPLRSVSGSDSTFVVVTAPPHPGEVATLTRVGSTFGPKLAVLVYPVNPATLPPEAQSLLEGRASVARLSLMRAGWDVLVMNPNQRLKDTWNANRSSARSPIGSSR